MLDKELASGAEELALLVDAVQDYAIVLLGMDGEIRTWNRGAQRTFGYSSNEAIGENVARLYGHIELDDVARQGRIEYEGRALRRDGERFWANTIITALRDQGSIRGFAMVTRDLTERRDAEKNLQQSETIFRLLVDSVQDYAIFMLDPNGNVESWNLGAERIKQYRADEIIGKHFSIFYPPEDIESRKPWRELETAIHDGRVEDEGWRVRKDGSRFWANVVITAVYDDEHQLRGFAKVTRDISARRDAEETRAALLEQREARVQAEEEKRRAEASYRAAQEANRAKDEFLMTLSHELRTPMTAILGWSRLLPTLPVSDASFKDAIAAIGRSAQLQAKLIDDVLDISRIVSGKLRLAIDVIDVVPILRAAVDAVRPSADAKNISITTNFEPGLGSATVDPVRLQQIVWNLLANAVKFTVKNGHVELAAKRTASQLQISVCDTGEGIEPGFLPHVFEPFRQAETPSTRVHGGLGLGLSIVRYLAEAHGGSVSAESEGRGKGSKFIVSLPMRAMNLAERAASRNDETDAPHFADLANHSVLVIDDDRDGRELITATLRRAGANITAVDSPSAALEHVDRHRPDLILTDIAMPEMDGWTLLKRLRERRELDATPIVALTAFPATERHGEESGFDRYLRKPIDPFELTEKLSELLKRSA